MVCPYTAKKWIKNLYKYQWYFNNPRNMKSRHLFINSHEHLYKDTTIFTHNPNEFQYYHVIKDFNDKWQACVFNEFYNPRNSKPFKVNQDNYNYLIENMPEIHIRNVFNSLETKVEYIIYIEGKYVRLGNNYITSLEKLQQLNKSNNFEFMSEYAYSMYKQSYLSILKNYEKLPTTNYNIIKQSVNVEKLNMTLDQIIHFSHIFFLNKFKKN